MVRGGGRGRCLELGRQLRHAVRVAAIVAHLVRVELGLGLGLGLGFGLGVAVGHRSPLCVARVRGPRQHRRRGAPRRRPPLPSTRTTRVCVRLGVERRGIRSFGRASRQSPSNGGRAARAQLARSAQRSQEPGAPSPRRPGERAVAPPRQASEEWHCRGGASTMPVRRGTVANHQLGASACCARLPPRGRPPCSRAGRAWRAA